MLTDSQRTCWVENGYIHLQGFFTSHAVDKLESAEKLAWQIAPNYIVVDDLFTGVRSYMSSLPEAERQHQRFKVSDLYLNFQIVRDTLLNPALVEIISELLNEVPVLINTLNLHKGSEQPDHIDTLYMTPLTFQKVVAVWIALEEVSYDSGPVRYYPRSHRIPAFRFSNGGYHEMPDEVNAWRNYIQEQIREFSLTPEYLTAHRGEIGRAHV